ncbi:MAG: hypothetical protein J6M53_06410 [Bacteroidaceae bacterium]|nr:hypothetical protein [Bacteroidaceae bacterium]
MLEHNCVIIPDLGGFVAQYVPARFDAESQKFFPPTRKVAFNAALTMNDGLLVQSLMQVYDSTFPEMQRVVEDKVADIKDSLFTDGAYDIPGVGRLTVNLEGSPVFEPALDDIASPALYGLEYIDAAPAAKPQEAISLTRGLVRREAGGYVVRINRHVANLAAAAVAAVFCFFTWTAPAADTTGQPAQAKLFSTELFATMAPTATEEAAPQEEAVEQESATEEAEAAQETTETTVVTPESAPYTIVLAQGLNESLAALLVERLQKAGLAEGRAVAEGKYTAVRYGSFQTYDEALRFLQAQKQHADFAQAWVYKLPQ